MIFLGCWSIFSSVVTANPSRSYAQIWGAHRRKQSQHYFTGLLFIFIPLLKSVIIVFVNQKTSLPLFKPYFFFTENSLCDFTTCTHKFKWLFYNFLPKLVLNADHKDFWFNSDLKFDMVNSIYTHLRIKIPPHNIKKIEYWLNSTNQI